MSTQSFVPIVRGKCMSVSGWFYTYVHLPGRTQKCETRCLPVYKYVCRYTSLFGFQYVRTHEYFVLGTYTVNVGVDPCVPPIHTYERRDCPYKRETTSTVVKFFTPINPRSVQKLISRMEKVPSSNPTLNPHLRLLLPPSLRPQPRKPKETPRRGKNGIGPNTSTNMGSLPRETRSPSLVECDCRFFPDRRHYPSVTKIQVSLPLSLSLSKVQILSKTGQGRT